MFPYGHQAKTIANRKHVADRYTGAQWAARQLVNSSRGHYVLESYNVIGQRSWWGDLDDNVAELDFYGQCELEPLY